MIDADRSAFGSRSSAGRLSFNTRASGPVRGTLTNVVTATLATMVDDDQLEVYLRPGIESGLTRAQIMEAMTHLGFYAGWGRATSAMTAVARTLGK